MLTNSGMVISNSSINAWVVLSASLDGYILSHNFSYRSHCGCGYKVFPNARLSFTLIHGKGCGSSRLTRNTKYLGRLTTLINPKVAPIPRKDIAQKSDNISDIHR